MGLAVSLSPPHTNPSPHAQETTPPSNLDCNVVFNPEPATFSSGWKYGGVSPEATYVSPPTDDTPSPVSPTNAVQIDAFSIFQDPLATSPQRKTIQYDFSQAVAPYGIPTPPGSGAYIWRCKVYIPVEWTDGSSSLNQLNIPNFREVRCQGGASDKPAPPGQPYYPVTYITNSYPVLANSLTFLVSDTKIPVGNRVLTDAWNSICMVWTAAADGTYSTQYFLNGESASPAVNLPTGTDVDYALYTIVGATTNRVANYSAIFGDVGFCTAPLGDTLPSDCGGGIV